MGGAKKRSLAQAERQQSLQSKKTTGKTEKPKSGEKAKSKLAEKPATEAGLPNINSKEFIGELGKMKAVTPSSVASRFNMRLSAAKDILEDLARSGVLTLIGGGNRLKIYAVASS
jgi:ribosomal protein S25